MAAKILFMDRHSIDASDLAMYHIEMSEISPGRRLRDAVEAERPLQVAGTINAYSALLAGKAGFRAIYLSGAGVANASFGLPDLGITSLNDVCEDARRICGATELPLPGGCRHRFRRRILHRAHDT